MRFRACLEIGRAALTPFFLVAVCVWMVACARDANRTPDEGLIGTDVGAFSLFNGSAGAGNSRVAVFDRKTRRIHQFETADMTLQRSFVVMDPDNEHDLIYDGGSDFIIDWSAKHIAIIGKDGQTVLDPFHLAGKALSAAFRAPTTDGRNGILVMYDDLASVGILILDREGTIKGKTLRGRLVEGDTGIAAGDLTEDGRLVLVLTDDRIAVINVIQTIEQDKWVTESTPYASGLQKVSWIAPVRGKPNQIFAKAADKIAILDVSARTIVHSSDTTALALVKLSKFVDPHAIYEGDNKTYLFYPGDNSEVKSRVFANTNTGEEGQADVLAASFLDMTADQWMTVATKGSGWRRWPDQTRESIDAALSRRLQNCRFSDLLATSSIHLPDGPQVRLTRNSAFLLFPSDLGYAVNHPFDGGARTELKMFMQPYIR